MLTQDRLTPIDECPPIDLDKHYELRYWCTRLAVTPDVLRAAVAAVGTQPREVEEYLASAKSDS